jgi:hypothetical protein
MVLKQFCDSSDEADQTMGIIGYSALSISRLSLFTCVFNELTRR